MLSHPIDQSLRVTHLRCHVRNLVHERVRQLHHCWLYFTGSKHDLFQDWDLEVEQVERALKAGLDQSGRLGWSFCSLPCIFTNQRDIICNVKAHVVLIEFDREV